MEVRESIVYLGLGANLGNCIENLEKAIDLLNSGENKVLRKSSYYESDAWGFESDNVFYNCCIELSTNLSPESLLDLTQCIEQSIGRKEKSSNSNYSDRIIDIDILFFGGSIITSEVLSIPHPHLQERNFVLQPMTEIAPNFIHPITKLTMTQLLINSKDNNHIKAVKKS